MRHRFPVPQSVVRPPAASYSPPMTRRTLMTRLWMILTGALGSAYAQPLIDVVVERERIAREIARVEDEIAKFKSLELAA
jgi:putative effector of murein hydrolase